MRAGYHAMSMRSTLVCAHHLQERLFAQALDRLVRLRLADQHKEVDWHIGRPRLPAALEIAPRSLDAVGVGRRAKLRQLAAHLFADPGILRGRIHLFQVSDGKLSLALLG